MALNKKHDPRLEALILKAADVLQTNPHLIAPLTPLPDAEYAEIVRDRQELERVWDEIERQRGGLVTEELGAQAVDEDRGK